MLTYVIDLAKMIYMLIEERCYTACTNVWIDERMVTFLHQIPTLFVVPEREIMAVGCFIYLERLRGKCPARSFKVTVSHYV